MGPRCALKETNSSKMINIKTYVDKAFYKKKRKRKNPCLSRQMIKSHLNEKIRLVQHPSVPQDNKARSVEGKGKCGTKESYSQARHHPLDRHERENFKCARAQGLPHT